MVILIHLGSQKNPCSTAVYSLQSCSPVTHVHNVTLHPPVEGAMAAYALCLLYKEGYGCDFRPGWPTTLISREWEQPATIPVERKGRHLATGGRARKAALGWVFVWIRGRFGSHPVMISQCSPEVRRAAKRVGGPATRGYAPGVGCLPSSKHSSSGVRSGRPSLNLATGVRMVCGELVCCTNRLAGRRVRDPGCNYLTSQVGASLLRVGYSPIPVSHRTFREIRGRVGMSSQSRTVRVRRCGLTWYHFTVQNKSNLAGGDVRREGKSGGGLLTGVDTYTVHRLGPGWGSAGKLLKSAAGIPLVAVTQPSHTRLPLTTPFWRGVGWDSDIRPGTMLKAWAQMATSHVVWIVDVTLSNRAWEPASAKVNSHKQMPHMSAESLSKGGVGENKTNALRACWHARAK